MPFLNLAFPSLPRDGIAKVGEPGSDFMGIQAAWNMAHHVMAFSEFFLSLGILSLMKVHTDNCMIGWVHNFFELIKKLEKHR